MKHYVSEGSNAGLSPYLRRRRRIRPGQVHRRVPPQVAARRVPVPAQPDDVPGDHPAGVDRREARHVGQERDDRDGRLQARTRQLRREAKRASSSETTGTGAAARRSTACGSRSTRAPRRWCSRCGRDRSTSRFSCRRRRRRPFKNNSQVHLLLTAGLAAPAGLHADRHRAVPGRAGTPGHGARDQPAAADREDHARGGTLGNDNPFWNRFLSTPPGIAQRRQNLNQARSLLRAANAENLKFTLTTWDFLEHTDHAASLQAYARQAGIEMGIEVMASKYYDSEPPGADYATTTPWLNRPAR